MHVFGARAMHFDRIQLFQLFHLRRLSETMSRFSLQQKRRIWQVSRADSTSHQKVPKSQSKARNCKQVIFLFKFFWNSRFSSVEIGAFQIFFPSLNVTLHREREDYSTTQFVSELGGAAGLFLGVSLISVIKIIDHLFTLAAKHYEDVVQEYSYAVRRVRENICQTDLQVHMTLKSDWKVFYSRWYFLGYERTYRKRRNQKFEGRFLDIFILILQQDLF